MYAPAHAANEIPDMVRQDGVARMSHEIKAHRVDNYLHLIVTGDNTPQDVTGYLQQVPGICADHGLFDVLIEEHLTGPSLGTVDIFDVVCAAIASAAPAVRRIAFVDTNPEHRSSNMSFAETVAVNRGVNVKVFPDLPSAVEWIRRR